MRTTTSLWAVLAALAAAACASTIGAQDAAAPGALASQVDQRFAALDAHFAAQTEAGVRAGYVALIAEDGEIVHTLETGYADAENALAITADTHFRIASMTKPVTSVAALILIEEGVIGLDDPVADYIPAIADMEVALSPVFDAGAPAPTRPAARDMTVRHLLTHTSGLGYLFDFQTELGALYRERSLYAGEGDLAEHVSWLTELPLYADPGAMWMYSWSDDVLGRVVEVASGQPFEDFVAERVLAPLGMDDTGFFLTEGAREAITAETALVYAHDEAGALVPAYSARTEYYPDWPSGGGGLISTPADYMRFLQMLANGGELDGARVLSADMVAMMTTPQIDRAVIPEGQFEGLSYGFGVGVTTDAEASSVEDRDGDYFWGGYFDTRFFVSPSTGVVAAVFSQYEAGPNAPETDTFADLARLVYQGLEE